MVRSASYHVGASGHVLDNASDVLKHAWQMLLSYGAPGALGVENDMEIDIGIGMCHGET